MVYEEGHHLGIVPCQEPALSCLEANDPCLLLLGEWLLVQFFTHSSVGVTRLSSTANQGHDRVHSPLIDALLGSREELFFSDFMFSKWGN